MFTILLLIAAIIFLVLWRDAKQQVARTRREEYDNGYSAGYWALADRLKTLLFQRDATFDMNVLRREIGVVESESEEVDSEPITPEFTMPENTVPELSLDEQAAAVVDEIHQRSRHDSQSIRNLNVLLFVSSLLFVAAGAAFVSAAMPESIKLLGIWALVAAFYAVGLFLQDSKKLRPAGIAFAGTGLGLLPFAGLALYQLTSMSGNAAWLITSLIGSVAYFYAAITMRSQVVSYLTLAFVLSFAASFGGTVALPMVWSFVAIIAVSIAINLFAYAWPDLVPAVFREPIEASAQIVVPLTIVASLFFTDKMSLGSYELITGVSLAYYVVSWLQTGSATYRHLVRALAQILILLVVWDVSSASTTTLGVTLAVTAVVQQILSMLLRKRESQQESWVWIGLMQCVMFIAPIFWLGSTYVEELLTINYLLLGALSLTATMVFRVTAAAIPGVIMSVLLPFIVGRLLLDPPLSWEMLSIWFAFGAGLMVLGRLYLNKARAGQSKLLLDASFIVYVALSILLAMTTTTVAVVILLVAAALFWVYSYVARLPLLSVLGNVSVVWAVSRLFADSTITSDWRPLAVLGIVGPVLYGAAWYMISQKDEKRTLGLLAVFWIVAAVTITTSFFNDATEISAAALLILVAGTLAIEGQRQKQQGIIEAAAYIATFGLQRIVAIGSDGEVNMLIYAHWWALTIFAVGRWFGKSDSRTVAAMAIVTFMSAIYALGEGGMYQLLFLAEHVAVLIVGVLTNRQWAIRWGLIASILAILWFLKDIAYVALAFLGLVVIGIVIWRLNRSNHP